MGTTCVIRERLDKSLRWVTLGFLYCFWQNKGAPSWKDKKLKVLERKKHLFVVLFYGVMSFQVRTSFPDNLQLCRWEFVLLQLLSYTLFTGLLSSFILVYGASLPFVSCHYSSVSDEKKIEILWLCISASPFFSSVERKNWIDICLTRTYGG